MISKEMHSHLLQTLTGWKQKLCELATVNPLFVETFFREETYLSRAKQSGFSQTPEWLNILHDTLTLLEMLMLKRL